MNKYIIGILFAFLLSIMNSINVFAETQKNGSLWIPVNYSNTYTSAQGMCIDDERNVYIAKQNNYNDVILYKITKDGEKEKEEIFSYFEMGHANDMTFCSENGHIYIAICDVAIEYSVIEIDQSLEIVKKYKISDFPKMKTTSSGIAYEPEYNVFYLKYGKKIYIYRCDFETGKFIYEDTIKLNEGNYSGYTRQGLSANSGLVFIPLYNSKGGMEYSIVRVYEIIKKNNGKFSVNYLDTYQFDNSSRGYFEIESIDFINHVMFIMTNGSKKGKSSYDEIYMIPPCKYLIEHSIRAKKKTASE